MFNQTGKQLGNYRLLNLIGKGGFAEVYRGEHVYLKTQAAIKVMRVQLTDRDVEDFLTEARTIAHLSHSHIINVLECGVEHDTPFLVMKYATHGTLRQRHPKGTRVPLATVVPYVMQIADALQYAHTKKIIHRDVKPENMLLGEEDDVLLSDFGTATIVQNTITQGPQTMVGTIYYTAPEQLKGKACFASDQYALAMVLFEWLSGKRPFRGSFGEVMSQHVLTQPPHLQDFTLDIPPMVDNVIQIALQKEPGDRFSNIQAFANAFFQASNGDGRITRPISINTERLPGELSEENTFLLTPSHKPLVTPRFDEDDALDLTPATKRLLPSHTAIEDLPTTAIPAGKGDVTLVTSTPSTGEVALATPTTGPNTALSAPTPIPVFTPTTATTNPIAPITTASPGKRHMTRRVALASAAAVVVAASGLTWLELMHKIVPLPVLGGHAITPSPTPNASQRATLYTYRGHRSPVNDLQWSFDGTRIASGSADHTAQVWDAMTGAHPVTFIGHSEGVRCLSWLYPGTRIVSGSKDTTVQVWNASNGDSILVYHDHLSSINGVAGSSDGSLIASASYNVAHIWRTTNSDRITSYHGRTDGINAIAWSPDGKRIVTGNQNTMIKVWSASNGNTIYLTYRGHSSPVRTLAWMPGGNLVASGSEDGQVRVWNPLKGHDMLVYKGHTDHVNGVAWSPNGVLIASASADRTVQIWNARTGEPVFKYKNHLSPINAVAWSPNSQYLASGGGDHIVHVWKMPEP